MTFRRMLFLIGLLLICGFAFATQQFAAQVIKVQKISAHAVDTHKKTAVLLMDLANNSSHSRTLIAAYSPVAQQLQLQMNQIVIPPHRVKQLQLGSVHFVSNQVPVVLTFSDGSWLTVKTKV